MQTAFREKRESTVGDKNYLRSPKVRVRESQKVPGILFGTIPVLNHHIDG
jgi:hypothetical protein